MWPVNAVLVMYTNSRMTSMNNQLHVKCCTTFMIVHLPAKCDNVQPSLQGARAPSHRHAHRHNIIINIIQLSSPAMVHMRARVDVVRFMVANLFPRPFRLDMMCCQTWTDITIDENSHVGEHVCVQMCMPYCVVSTYLYTFRGD